MVLIFGEYDSGVLPFLQYGLQWNVTWGRVNRLTELEMGNSNLEGMSGPALCAKARTAWTFNSLSLSAFHDGLLLLPSAGGFGRIVKLQQAFPGTLLPQHGPDYEAPVPRDISLLVSPDFSLRCVHPGVASW